MAVTSSPLLLGMWWIYSIMKVLVPDSHVLSAAQGSQLRMCKSTSRHTWCEWAIGGLSDKLQSSLYLHVWLTAASVGSCKVWETRYAYVL